VPLDGGLHHAAADGLLGAVGEGRLEDEAQGRGMASGHSSITRTRAFARSGRGVLEPSSTTTTSTSTPYCAKAHRTARSSLAQRSRVGIAVVMVGWGTL